MYLSICLLVILKEIDVGDVCAGKYSSDEHWYRAEVIGIRADSTEASSPRQVQLKFIDYGNEEEMPYSSVSKTLFRIKERVIDENCGGLGRPIMFLL